MLKKTKADQGFTEPLVGKKAKIITKNKSFDGKIILETKNTIGIEENGKKKTIPKKNCEIIIDGKTIKGEKITKRIEDRIKTR